MGYTTDFTGRFELSKELTASQAAEIADMFDNPPEDGPGSYCQWIATTDGRGIEWDGNEKFYNYVEWLQWLIDKRLTPWGISIVGEVRFQGEDPDDRGLLFVKNGKVVKAMDTVIPATAKTYKPAQAE